MTNLETLAARLRQLADEIDSPEPVTQEQAANRVPVPDRWYTDWRNEMRAKYPEPPPCCICGFAHGDDIKHYTNDRQS